jgi:hypothetical protein
MASVGSKRWGGVTAPVEPVASTGAATLADEHSVSWPLDLALSSGRPTPTRPARFSLFSSHYHRLLNRFIAFLVPPGRRVLVVGSGTGALLHSLHPSVGVGVELDADRVSEESREFPSMRFVSGAAGASGVTGTFDYVVLADAVGELDDIQGVFSGLRRFMKPETRLIVTYYNAFWEPILRLAEWIGFKAAGRAQNWLPVEDIEGFLSLAGFATIRKGGRFLLPISIPGVAWLCNNVLAALPLFRSLCLTHYVIARSGREQTAKRAYRCSVVVPCRNEAGNIDDIVRRTPVLGNGTELIFVDGNSTDGTVGKIEAAMAAYRGPHSLRLLHQGEGRGKGDAVRKGFEAASGDVLMILDADITVDPEALPKFYDAIANGHGEFINGSRLVYPMEQQAMRFLNLLGNRFFSAVFTWLLEQRLRDTLCGTKVLFKRDYEKIKAGRAYFGEFDPFGDFDLLFGAAKLNLKIVEVPIRYRERTYGVTKIQRFRHGLLLFRMCAVAYRRLRLY